LEDCKLSHARIIAYYAQLPSCDSSFALSMVPDRVYCAGLFSPVPLQPSEIAQFLMNDNLDYDLMIKALYPMVHPNITETLDGCVHTFVNLAMILDFLLYDDVALRHLVLTP
jgi:hypothetical protein